MKPILFIELTHENLYKIHIFRKAIFDNQPVDSEYNPLPEDRPGGFDWGENEAQPRD